MEKSTNFGRPWSFEVLSPIPHIITNAYMTDVTPTVQFVSCLLMKIAKNGSVSQITNAKASAVFAAIVWE